MGDYKGAIQDFDKALALDPKNAVAYNGRAMAMDKLVNDDLMN